MKDALIVSGKLFVVASTKEWLVTYRVSQKKCNIAISCLDLFQRSNLTFSHVFRNQNFELVPLQITIQNLKFPKHANNACPDITLLSSEFLVYSKWKHCML